ncbi:MAG TPA: glycerophosphodiester phosphodiesterase [Geminicoccaceae bacterium]
MRVSPGLLFAAVGLLLGAAAPPGAAFDLQGHRGARGLAPENTLPGFETALRIGVTTLELDLGMSRDGELVVSHDPRLDPDLTRDPAGRWLEPPGPRLLDLDLEQIQAFDVGRSRPGSDHAEDFPEQRPADGARVPTLAEVVALTRRLGADAVRFNVETKLSPLEPDLAPPPEVFARELVEEIRALGIAGRTTVQSFDWRTLRVVNERAPEVRTVCLTAERRWLDTLERWRAGASPWLAGLDADDFESVPDLVGAAGCEVWSPYHGDLAAADLARAHALGLEVVVWTVNDRESMAHLIDLGVDGIITDYPDRLREVAGGRGRTLPVPVVP